MAVKQLCQVPARHACAGVCHLAALRALRHLSLQECPHVNGTGFAAFAARSHALESLDLSDCIGFSQPGS